MRNLYICWFHIPFCFMYSFDHLFVGNMYSLHSGKKKDNFTFVTLYIFMLVIQKGNFLMKLQKSPIDFYQVWPLQYLSVTQKQQICKQFHLRQYGRFIWHQAVWSNISTITSRVELKAMFQPDLGIPCGWIYSHYLILIGSLVMIRQTSSWRR